MASKENQEALEHIKTIIVDATHTKARYNQKSPKEFLQEKSRHTRKAVYQFDKSMKEEFPKKNTSNEVKDELAYCEKLIAIIENRPQIANLPAVKEKTERCLRSDFQHQARKNSA